MNDLASVVDNRIKWLTAMQLRQAADPLNRQMALHVCMSWLNAVINNQRDGEILAEIGQQLFTIVGDPRFDGIDG